MNARGFVSFATAPRAVPIYSSLEFGTLPRRGVSAPAGAFSVSGVCHGL